MHKISGEEWDLRQAIRHWLGIRCVVYVDREANSVMAPYCDRGYLFPLLSLLVITYCILVKAMLARHEHLSTCRYFGSLEPDLTPRRRIDRPPEQRGEGVGAYLNALPPLLPGGVGAHAATLSGAQPQSATVRRRSDE